ncbi:MAG: protein translocase subunit SecF [Firmicutes bacterium]|nr:protein translocase subunit SecF [Bacillota bacterium]
MKNFKNAIVNREVDVVKRRKLWYIIPGIIIAIALIMLPIHNVWQGSPLNIALDFVGGYAMTVRLGDRLTEDTVEYYQDRIIAIGQDLRPEATEANPNPEPFGITILRREMMLQGEREDASIYFRFRALRSPDYRSNEDFMEYVVARFVDELAVLFAFTPSVTASGNRFTATYHNENINHLLNDANTAFGTEVLNEIVARGTSRNVTISIVSISVNDANLATVTIDATGTGVNIENVMYALTLSDPYSGSADHAGMTSPTIGGELLLAGILAIILAFVLKLMYIALRFDLSSGTAAVTGLLHDLIMMFSFMLIFHIEIGVTFIAALITIMGYSLNNSFILFDRVKEKTKPYGNKEFDTKMIANQAAGDTIFRSFATTLTGLFPIVAIAIIGFLGVPSIQIFAFPIIIGLISGTYSTLTILPTTWVSMKNSWFKRQKAKGYMPKTDQLLEAEATVS